MIPWFFTTFFKLAPKKKHEKLVSDPSFFVFFKFPPTKLFEPKVLAPEPVLAAGAAAGATFPPEKNGGRRFGQFQKKAVIFQAVGYKPTS